MEKGSFYQPLKDNVSNPGHGHSPVSYDVTPEQSNLLNQNKNSEMEHHDHDDVRSTLRGCESQKQSVTPPLSDDDKDLDLSDPNPSPKATKPNEKDYHYSLLFDKIVLDHDICDSA